VPLLRTTRRRFVGRRSRLEQGRLERARETGAHGLERAREAVTPAVEQVREAAAPQLALAKEKIVDEVLPRVGAGVAAALAASEPVREEAKRRGSATVAALKGDLEPPAPPRRKRRLGKFLFLTGIAAAATAAVKAWRNSRNRDEWTSADTYASTTGMPPRTTTGAGTTTADSAGSTPTGTMAAPADAAAASPDEALADEARATVTSPDTDTVGPVTEPAAVSEQEVDDAIREAEAKRSS
jgi:hypothetical protein